MARKAGQLISRGPRTWLVRIPLGRVEIPNPLAIAIGRERRS
jgi:hypothetical protein